jgi:hypothetical protein
MQRIRSRMCGGWYNRAGYTASACDDQVEVARRIGSCCALLIRFDVAGSHCGAVVLGRSIVPSAGTPELGHGAPQVGTCYQADSAVRHRMSDLHVKLRSDAHWSRRNGWSMPGLDSSRGQVGDEQRIAYIVPTVHGRM